MNNVSPELNGDLERVVFQLMNTNRFMFYAFFMSEINKTFTARKEIETAALAKHPLVRVPQMLFNPEYWQSLTLPQRKYLVLHEAEHYINEHFHMTPMFGWERPMDNIAYDLYINTHLNATDEFKNGTIDMPPGGIDVSTFPELKMEPCKGSDYYYNILMRAKKKKEGSKGEKDSLAGEKGNKNGTSGCKNLDAMLDNQEALEKMHATWEELTEGMSDVEKEALRRDISDKVKRAAQDCEKSRGTVPAHLQDIIQKEIEVIESSVSWKAMLRRFMGSAISTDVYSTRKKPNFRYPDAGSLKYKHKVSGVFLCDSSGSMSDYDMSEMNNEMYHLYRAGAAVDYASWDAECEPHKKYDGKLTFERTKYGGKNCASSHGDMRKINAVN